MIRWTGERVSLLDNADPEEVEAFIERLREGTPTPAEQERFQEVGFTVDEWKGGPGDGRIPHVSDELLTKRSIATALEILGEYKTSSGAVQVTHICPCSRPIHIELLPVAAAA